MCVCVCVCVCTGHGRKGGRCLMTNVCMLILYVLMSVLFCVCVVVVVDLFEYETYVPRAHLRKGALRLDCY